MRLLVALAGFSAIYLNSDVAAATLPKPSESTAPNMQSGNETNDVGNISRDGVFVSAHVQGMSRRSSVQATTSQVDYCYDFPPNKTFISIQASSKAKKKLSKILRSTSATVVFVYFNLVVGGTTYHPGSCPADGKSAIDARTPLGWVFLRESARGEAFDRNAFAKAYITLPVSFPRIYSLGILAGGHVEDLNHAVYGMEAVVDPAGGCWERFDMKERTDRIFDAVTEFYKQLWKPTDSNPSWEICFSNPVTSGLPLAIPDTVKSETPAYHCKDEDGNFSQPKRQDVFVALISLCTLLAVAFFFFQVYLVLGFVMTVFLWGDDDPSHRLVNKGKTVRLRSSFFSELRLPGNVSIGGIICAQEFLGLKAAWRLKVALVIAVLTVLYTVFPIYTRRNIFTPHENENDTETTLNVQYAETFGKCDYSDSAGWEFALTIFPIALVCCVLCMDPSKFDSHGSGRYTLELIAQLLRLPLRAIAAACMLPFALTRVLVHWPSPPWLRGDSSGRFTTQLPIYFFVALPLWAILWFTVAPILVTAVSIVEVLEAIGSVLLVGAAFVHLRKKQVDFDRKNKVFHIFAKPSAELYGRQKISAERIFMFLKDLGISVGVPSALVVFLTSVAIVTSLLLMFALLTSFAVWLEHPIEATLILSWAFSMIRELGKAKADYYAPLETVWRIHVEALENMILKGHNKDIQVKEEDCHGDLLAFDLNIRDTADKIDWAVFLSEAEKTFYVTCRDLLKKYCPRKLQNLKRDWTNSHQLEPTKREVSFVDGYKDTEVSVKTAIRLTCKEEDRQEVDGYSKELVDLQAVLRVLFFLRVAETLAVILIFFTALLLLIGFHTIFKSTDQNITIVLVLQFLILPISAYYRTNSGRVTIGNHDKKRIKRTIKMKLKKAMDKAMLMSPSLTRNKCDVSKEEDDKGCFDVLPSHCTCYSSCPDFIREGWKQACPFDLLITNSRRKNSQEERRKNRRLTDEESWL